MVDTSIISDIITALRSKFEAKSNKTNDLSGDFSSDNNSYPTVKAVKEWTTNIADDKLDSADVPTKTSDLTNDGADGTHPFLTEHQSLDTTVVTVEKQSTPETDATATYVIKQNGAQVGTKINIPKDFLLKSASRETVGATPTSIEEDNNLTTGDVYLDFVVNTIDDDETDSHLIIPVNDLINTYTADEATLTLSNGQFKIKNNGVTANQLAGSINTQLGYADDFHNSTAATITATDVTNWNNKGSSNLTTSDVENVVEDYLSAITDALDE